MEIADILKELESVFCLNNEKSSAFYKMLNSLASNTIYEKFHKSLEYKFDKNDFIAKANLLSALLEMILENPDLIATINEEAETRKSIVDKIFDMMSLLYGELFKQNNRFSVNDLRYLLMYSILSYLADKQTVSSLIIEEYNQKLSLQSEKIDEMDCLERLEFETYYLIILMLSNIKNYDGLVNLNNYMHKANDTLAAAQEHELNKESIDIKNGLRITAFGNMIYLTSLLKEYLFSGKISGEESQDMNSLIDIYSYNAFHLLEHEDIELKLIGHLIKYAYDKIVDNSIWTIADKSPKIKAFIKRNLASKNHYVYSLLPSQRDVISDVLTPKKSIVVSMPTSSGKSLLAQMQILFTLHNYQTDDFKPTICYVVPTNALIGQVKHDLKESFEGFDLNIETALPYYEVDEIEEEVLTLKHIDILISTPEKLESLIRQEHKSILNTRLVIVDEAHNLSDPSRGSKFELLLSIIKSKLKEANFMLLSPFISNANDVGEWLADSKRNSATVSVEWIPTQQYIGCNLLSNNKTISKLQFYKSARSQLGTENTEIVLQKKPEVMRKELGMDKVDRNVRLGVILNDFIEQKGNILILCGGIDSSKKTASSITRYFVSNGKLIDMSDDEDIKSVREIIKLECGESDDLYTCIKYGVCYHNSGLSGLIKEELEKLIRKNKIKMVFATTTLAQGMNFPISTVVFNTIKFRNPNRYLSNSEFWNIAGRAGRAFKDKEGYIILPYDRTQKQTKANTERYIKNDLEEIISSLNIYFRDDVDINFDYDTLKQPEYLPMLNLLQYINHILNISYDYNINSNDIAKIRNILNDSYLYHSLTKEKGYVNAQFKLNGFVTKYVRHINENTKEDMSKADELGISDISFSKVKSMIGAYIHNLKESGDLEYKASEVIMKSKNIDKLAEIISIISKIPEINISMMTNQGTLDSYAIAQILVKWISGDNILDIAESIKRENQSIDDVMPLCNKYLNSQMKSYMPWGINVYQTICYDLESEDAQLLPSFIYYGVSDRKSIILSKFGVPRFAVKNVISILEKKYPGLEISIQNSSEIRHLIKGISSIEYSKINADPDIVKKLIDEKIDY